ncbi:MAG: hypothetical protein IMW89_20800, partial [Ktedonobacteraceae bacterium]|nr:hypothetical protein [Ktedonobacteraceae bacterium]
LLLLGLLSSCSFLGFGGTAPTTGTGGNGGKAPAPLTPLQVVQNAANAMRQLKTVHVTMNAATTTTASTAGNNGAQNTTLNVQVEGDEVLPDQAALKLSIGQVVGGQMTTMAEIVMGNKIYVQNAKGKWYVLDLAAFTSASGNPFASAQVSNYNNLLTLAQKSPLVDNGEESLNGVTVRHITVNFGKNVLRELLNTTGQINNLQAQQRQKLEAFLNSVDLEKPTLDLWIDKATFYVQRMELKFTLQTQAQGNTPASTTTEDTVIDYSKFNAPVTISAPNGATPTNDLATIFK